MKKRFKNILIGATIPSMAMPLAFTIVSCGNNEHMYDELAQRLKADAIEEFTGNRRTIKGIASVYRDTFHTSKICEYLKQRIMKIMRMKEEDIHFDEYSSGKGDTGHNMYFDIPANDDQMAPIILQCHTDMVWRHDADFQASHPIPFKTTSLDGREILISEDLAGNRSSLGADNGMGIGLCLAIARNQNTFKHGKIRILMTTDEEEGDSGAKFVPYDGVDISKNWFCDAEKNEYIPYLLNLDLEDTLKTATCCGGTLEARWTGTKFTLIPVPEEKKNYAYHIYVKGLKGGYTGRFLDENRQNAIDIAFRFLHEINSLPGFGQPINIAKIIGKPSDKGEIGCSNRPDEAHIYFYCNEIKDETWLEIADLQKQWIKDYKETGIEPNLDIFCNPIQEGEVLPSYVLSSGEDGDTQALIDLVIALPYGPKAGTNYNTSYNIGAVRLNDPDLSESTQQVIVQVMGRSSLTEDLGGDPAVSEQTGGFWQEFKKISSDLLQEKGKDGTWTNKGWTPLWEHRDDNLLSKILQDGSNKLKLGLQSYDEPGWFEVAYFDLHTNGKLHMGDLGFDIERPHSRDETIYLDTMEPTIKLVLFAIQHAQKISIPFEDSKSVRKEEPYE